MNDLNMNALLHDHFLPSHDAKCEEVKVSEQEA